MRISRLGCRRSRDRDRGGPVGTGGHLPGQPCAAGPRRKRLWAQRGRQLLWGPGGPHRAGVGTGIWGALAVPSLPVPVLFAVPRLVFTSSNLRAAPRGGDIGARGLLLGSTPRPLPAPRRLSVPTPRRAGGCSGVPSSCVSPGRAEGHVQGRWAVRLRSLTAVAMTPAAPMRQETHEPAPRPAQPRGSCPSGVPAPPAHGAGLSFLPPRGPRSRTLGVPLGFPKCSGFGLQSQGHLQRAQNQPEAEEQLPRAPRSSLARRLLARGAVCPSRGWAGTFGPGSVHSSVLGPSSPHPPASPSPRAACAHPGACSPAELGEVSA